MDKYDWLLFIHVFGAFLVLGGAVAIGALQIAAIGRERPSEVALLLRLARIPELLINVGMPVVIVFGIWLAEYLNYGIFDEWVIGAIVLWVLAGALGGLGGSRYKRARLEAERLATTGDTPSGDLQALLRDRQALLLSWASGAAVVGMLILMIFKPGAY